MSAGRKAKGTGLVSSADRALYESLVPLNGQTRRTGNKTNAGLPGWKQMSVNVNPVISNTFITIPVKTETAPCARE